MTNLDDALSDLGVAEDEEVYVPAFTEEESDLDRKVNDLFAGSVVRKDLVKAVRGNAVVPGYVLEYLLGQYAASDDEDTIQDGIDMVRSILAEHYVNRNEKVLIQSTIREKGKHRIIDRVTVDLNTKQDFYEASFENLDIKGVPIDVNTVTNNQKLLVGGVWCICDIEYQPSDGPTEPWVLASLKPIQIAGVDFDRYNTARASFTTDEWIDVLMQSIGLNPEQFSLRDKLIALTRLIPFVERNYNLVELGPKGTGKSHTFSELSPNGALISGGEVTVAKLFVNNANGKLGLVGYWDVVAFDEFASNRRTDQNLVNIMKNYMANKQFNRGNQPLGAEASMVFIGNTSHTVPYMLQHSDLFDELPDSYRDAAWLDRIHHYIPGWEVSPIRSEMFSDGYGFVVDYLAEILHSKRSEDFSDKYQAHFSLGSDISTRDRDGIQKTFSGLMKLIHPTGTATPDEIEELLVYAIEGRKRVKDQILRIDATMRDNPPHFGYEDSLGDWHDVVTVEENQYPQLYRRDWSAEGARSSSDLPTYTPPAPTHQPYAARSVAPPLPIVPEGSSAPVVPDATMPLFEGIRDFKAGQTGVSYENVLLPYLVGAGKITIVDPYIRRPHQVRNIGDLLGLIALAKAPADEIAIELITGQIDQDHLKKDQLERLVALREAAQTFGITLDIRLDDTIHDRSILTNHGWRILLGKGLDIWEPPTNAIAEARQEFRRIKSDTTFTYARTPIEGA
ncbi:MULTISPECIES: BREX system Lon protease-like protein BrxL [unclassified Microbacterium]|uniref:BREX system Lon protease-like protein BrxL n=1 Tax=unclassified Microbacterium TaxID=2609290 RepID=UPI00214CCB05|nr:MULTISPECIES: BREX system Lon protease-like protein BrxL [unclassified Microbacterium]MCR2784135.1 BREX system Lon protease-like protein BrxL [Microbacterium sp. zg.B96]WIM15029.1 BREX system Lon protease-like protein BrxL [Microbacterium sp. zg-B96]